jgi:DNA (cytosine-5)-methyltransferase 1
MNRCAEAAASKALVNSTKRTDAMSDRPVGVDLCSGVGGMSLGFEQAGFNVIAAVDIERIHLETHAKNFPTCKTWCADLSSVSGDQIREKTEIGERQIDVVFSGPPCQGFSLIGKRASDDPRNMLLIHLAKIISELSPSYFVVENVEGILFGNAKNTLREFLERAGSAGYTTVEPTQVLDAAEFGVPQRRRRVFVLGYRKGLVPPEYPKPSHPYDENDENNGPTVWDAIADLPKISNYEYLFDEDAYHGSLAKPSDYAKLLRGDVRAPDDNSVGRSRNGDGLCGCLRTRHTKKTLRRFERTKPGTYDEVSRFYRLTKSGLALTLRAGTGPAQGSFMAPRPIHPFQSRCITVREAARLHSFPDWFYFHPTKWHGFRQIGNSVPPLLAKAVAQSVKRALVSSNQKG